MTSSGPHSSLKASSMLVPAVFLVLRKMNLWVWETIMPSPRQASAKANLFAKGGDIWTCLSRQSLPNESSMSDDGDLGGRGILTNSIALRSGLAFESPRPVREDRREVRVAARAGDLKHIFLIAGPSGSGKGTIMSEFV